MSEFKIVTIDQENGIARLEITFPCGTVGGVISNEYGDCACQNIHDNSLYNDRNLWKAITAHMNR